MTTTIPEASTLSGAATARHAAALLDLLGGHLRLSTVTGPGDISIQVPMDEAPVGERRAVLAAAARTLGRLAAPVPITVVTYDGDGDGSWGALHVLGTWMDGVGVDVWTAIIRPEARTLGLATCADCGHADHDGDVICLAAMTGPGGEHSCECGRPLDEPEVAAIPDYDGLALALAEAAWEAYDDEAAAAGIEAAR